MMDGSIELDNQNFPKRVLLHKKLFENHIPVV